MIFPSRCFLAAIVAAAVGISLNRVSRYPDQAEAAGISWPPHGETDDAALEAALIPPGASSSDPRPEPDRAGIHRQLTGKGKRVGGITLRTLWLVEYLENNLGGYRYSGFCDLYGQRRGQVDVVMRQDYRAGEKVFMDYAGPKFEVIDRSSGEALGMALFSAVPKEGAAGGWIRCRPYPVRACGIRRRVR